MPKQTVLASALLDLIHIGDVLVALLAIDVGTTRNYALRCVREPHRSPLDFIGALRNEETTCVRLDNHRWAWVDGDLHLS